jgi:hypothetical protein
MQGNTGTMFKTPTRNRKHTRKCKHPRKRNRKRDRKRKHTRERKRKRTAKPETRNPKPTIVNPTPWRAVALPRSRPQHHSVCVLSRFEWRDSALWREATAKQQVGDNYRSFLKPTDGHAHGCC